MTIVVILLIIASLPTILFLSYGDFKNIIVGVYMIMITGIKLLLDWLFSE